ncbi:MAG: histidine phosphatase family protein [Hyphomicrobiaceae bacterium]|nr:MAG: histidine phosphatase family protein [Hyphomicrobiaceae bacterium]
MARVYLVRHGEPALTGVMLGQADVPLSAAGRAQSAALQLPDAPVYSSPLRRALETARIGGASSQPAIEAGFTEITYGEWDGLPWATIEARWPAIARAKLADWFGVTPPGGERWDCFRERVLAALERVSKPAVIVAHQAVNAVIAGGDSLSFIQSYCEVIEIEL